MDADRWLKACKRPWEHSTAWKETSFRGTPLHNFETYSSIKVLLTLCYQEKDKQWSTLGSSETDPQNTINSQDWWQMEKSTLNKCCRHYQQPKKENRWTQTISCSQKLSHRITDLYVKRGSIKLTFRKWHGREHGWPWVCWHLNITPKVWFMKERIEKVDFIKHI